MTVNSGKSHLLMSGKQKVRAIIDNNDLGPQNVKELLRMTICLILKIILKN